ncbi:MAG: ribosome small subunit-dependent GTPase A [Coriobacteriia bacterium]|nr:ribosome small subunit-dependent GTPase A [Coriobacteriia bacterium]
MLDHIDEAATDDSSLDLLGFERYRALFAEHAAAGLMPARVIRTDRGALTAATAMGVVRAEVAVHLLKDAEEVEALPAVGDWIALRNDPDMDVALAEAVLPRHSAFVRRDPGKAAIGQVIAANIDTVFVLQPIDTVPNLRRLEREIALSWESGATPVIVLSKSDLSPDAAADLATAGSIAFGVDVVLESAVSGEGIEALLAYARGHRTVALIGPSGAGKSRLVNRLVGADVQAISDVREFDGKGRHTTVARELIPLPGGGVLIDTPGLRAVALWDAEAGIAAAFPEITELAATCRFADCTHETEPGCGVLEALESGVLGQDRYDSYVRLMKETAFTARQKDARLRAEEKNKWKTIKKTYRQHLRKNSE